MKSNKVLPRIIQFPNRELAAETKDNLKQVKSIINVGKIFYYRPN